MRVPPDDGPVAGMACCTVGLLSGVSFLSCELCDTTHNGIVCVAASSTPRSPLAASSGRCSECTTAAGDTARTSKRSANSDSLSWCDVDNIFSLLNATTPFGGTTMSVAPANRFDISSLVSQRSKATVTSSGPRSRNERPGGALNCSVGCGLTLRRYTHASFGCSAKLNVTARVEVEADDDDDDDDDDDEDSDGARNCGGCQAGRARPGCTRSMRCANPLLVTTAVSAATQCRTAPFESTNVTAKLPALVFDIRMRKVPESFFSNNICASNAGTKPLTKPPFNASIKRI
mmetsp:Transcript_13302/g.22902  ORF Transcript_13302/g.22902 Transcript_13302/m.22902 type:complete len:289 (-) Transcript_13302:384-1250(-)